MSWPDVPHWTLTIWLFALGATIGSFLNVCILRIPDKETLGDQIRALFHPPSRCPRCFSRIRAIDNIPIFGWLKLKGKCRNCQKKISFRYPAIELFNGILFVLAYWFIVPESGRLVDSCLFTPSGIGITGGQPNGQWWSVEVYSIFRFAWYMVLIEALVVATFIDFDLMIIPEASTFPATLVGITGAFVAGSFWLVPLWFQSPGHLQPLIQMFPSWIAKYIPGTTATGWIAFYPHLHAMGNSLAGMVAGWCIIQVVRGLGSWALKREAMGLGDAYLMAMIGAFMGWQAVVVVFFLAPLCALVVVATVFLFRRDSEIPYGPYISLATLLLILGWRDIWPRVEGVFALGPLLPVLFVVMAVMLVVILFFMQIVKRLLGIPLYFDEYEGEWTSADQLTYLQGENVDHQQGRWRNDCWPGMQSGRGTSYNDQWRRGCDGK